MSFAISTKNPSEYLSVFKEYVSSKLSYKNVTDTAICTICTKNPHELIYIQIRSPLKL